MTPPRIARAKGPARFFEEIGRADLLTQVPYESFRTTFEAFAAAPLATPT